MEHRHLLFIFLQARHNSLGVFRRVDSKAGVKGLEDSILGGRHPEF